MDNATKFKRIVELREIRKFEHLTGEDRTRGGFRSTLRVTSDRPSRVQAWTPGMQVPVSPTFMGAKDSATAYAQSVRDAEWRERKQRQEAKVGIVDNNFARLVEKQTQAFRALNAGLQTQLRRLSPEQRSKHIANALFGTPITPPDAG